MVCGAFDFARHHDIPCACLFQMDCELPAARHPILSGQPQLTLVNLVDILSVNNLHRCNPLITRRTMNVGPFIREVVYEYSCIVFCDTVTMNLQQSSAGPFFVFQQLMAAPAMDSKNPVFGQFFQK